MQSIRNTIKKTDHHTGFTLVEFIVIMSIFVIMIGVVLFNFTGFRSAVTMENLAQDIALSIRQIQVSAGATQSIAGSPGEEIPRGIHFEKDPAGGFKSTFYLFQDQNGDGFYTPDGSELLDEIIIQTPDIINQIYLTEEIEDITNNTNSINVGDYIGVTFSRFSTTAEFASQAGGKLSNWSYLVIEIKSPDPEKKPRYVIVSKIGQVSIQ